MTAYTSYNSAETWYSHKLCACEHHIMTV